MLHVVCVCVYVTMYNTPPPSEQLAYGIRYLSLFLGNIRGQNAERYTFEEITTTLSGLPTTPCSVIASLFAAENGGGKSIPKREEFHAPDKYEYETRINTRNLERILYLFEQGQIYMRGE